MSEAFAVERRVWSGVYIRRSGSTENKLVWLVLSFYYSHAMSLGGIETKEVF